MDGWSDAIRRIGGFETGLRGDDDNDAGAQERTGFDEAGPH
jgi:hypothetical protein